MNILKEIQAINEILQILFDKEFSVLSHVRILQFIICALKDNGSQTISQLDETIKELKEAIKKEEQKETT